MLFVFSMAKGFAIMKIKESGWIFLVLFSVFAVQLQAQQDSTIKKFGDSLNVIRDKKVYEQTVATDSNKEMVALKNYIHPLITDWKYATQDNFTHKILYHHPVAFARLPVARALQQVENELKEKGLGLKFYDAYRPYHVTVEMWRIVPDERYAANPAKGSGHNRGIAIDVSLIDLKTMKELRMPTTFDDFTEKAHHDYMNLDRAVLQNRRLLREVMEKHGFVALETEWWHYSWPDAERKFEVMDIPFGQFPSY